MALEPVRQNYYGTGGKGGTADAIVFLPLQALYITLFEQITEFSF